MRLGVARKARSVTMGSMKPKEVTASRAATTRASDPEDRPHTVLPWAKAPTVVTGLVLLQLFGRHGPVGGWLHSTFNYEVVFTWRAVVLALTTMSLPLFVRAARTAFEEVDVKFEQLARTLGAGEWRVFFTITLPLAKRGVLAGTLLAFARALGEFGATIMVAGNIPGRTTTLPVAIYQAVENGEDAHAWTLAGISAVIAFAAVFASERLQRRRR